MRFSSIFLRRVAGVFILSSSLCLSVVAQTPAPESKPSRSLLPRRRSQPINSDFLKQFNTSLAALADKVSPAVAQINVTGYGPMNDSGDSSSASWITRQYSLGSGVVVDPNGYVITNAHVVAGAQRIQVVLTVPGANEDEEGAAEVTREFDAKLLGVHKPTDLALLKIDAKDLPYLRLDHRRNVHKGEIVLALGSPLGLSNSVTMGVVSAVNRQPDADLPMVYIQTDAAINHGNSGGPLVNSEGEMVGINTFIYSSGGGNEGLGFAIPASVVDFIYQRLRKNGHVDRSEIGAVAETITPLLATALQLPLHRGVLVNDVQPGGPADTAGLRIKDILLTVDGHSIYSLPMLDASMYLHSPDEPMLVEVRRGQEKITLHIPIKEKKNATDRLIDLADPQKNLLPKLGVLGVSLADVKVEVMPDLRMQTGVVIIAKTAYGGSNDIGLRPGDVIHSVNATPIATFEELRAAIANIKVGDPVALQVERDGSMDFLTFEMD